MSPTELIVATPKLLLGELCKKYFYMEFYGNKANVSDNDIRSWTEERISPRKVIRVVCFLLGNSTASEFYMQTFRNTLSVPSS